MTNFNRIIQTIKSIKHSASQTNLSDHHHQQLNQHPTSNPSLSSTMINHPSLPILSLEIPSAHLLTNQFNPTPNTSTQDDQNLIGEDVDLDSSSLLSLQSDRSSSPWVDLGHRITTLDSTSHFLSSGGSSLSPAGHRRTQYVHFGPTQLTELVRLCSPMIFQRGLDTLGLFRPWRTAERSLHIGRLQLLFINYLLPSPPSTLESHHEQNPSLTTTRSVKVEDVQDELVFTLVHDLIHVLKWAIRHLSYQSTRFALQSTWYEEFSRTEREKGYPQNAYTSILLPLLPNPTQDLLDSIFQLLSAVAAHVDQNAMPASQLCRYLGFWILGRGTDSFVSFDHLYLEWDRSSRAFEHLFLAYLRSQNKLPKRLKELVGVYPLKPAALVFTPRFTTKVIKVLKVQITTFASPVQEPIESKQQENVDSHQRSSSLRRHTRTPTVRQATRPPSLRQSTRTPSLRQVARSYSRSRRSASISTSTPASVPPPPLPQPRGPLDILKAASEAVLSNGHDEESLTKSPSYKIWQTALEQAKSSDPLHLPLTENSIPKSEPLVSLLDNETLRVIQLTRPQAVTQPIIHEPTPNPSTEPIPTSSKSPSIGRPRSFSLDVSPLHSTPVHLTTLYEHSCSSRVLLSTKPFLETPLSSQEASVGSSSLGPTTSWAEFVASGFSSSTQHPETQLVTPEPIELPAPPRASMSTVRSAATTVRSAATTVHQYKRRTITRAKRHKGFTPSIRSFKADEQLTPRIDTPPPPLPPLPPLLSSVSLMNVDEAFPDVWLDTLGEPMIRSKWPNFVFSGLRKEISRSDQDQKISHFLVEESRLESKREEEEMVQMGHQGIVPSEPRLVNPNPVGLEELGVMSQSENASHLNHIPIDGAGSEGTHQALSISSMFLSLGKHSKRWISGLFDDHHSRLGTHWINHKNQKTKLTSDVEG
ncbi:uncharacterized protein MELLADRAFT_117220 [Melampsora larici-populina 98AG31]|uniref:Rho-GAP domain-containing protein n=1 Tax=Melampsora larici-populina (strain 98AG31 / pathotype 3-4-7) TaxID=747676 RepID=F4RUT5_MELLP|nr:uncharacterized protein MELLADRAFT_117220 [Melampsora larici-populina 98AG31]EGG03753.1 hypothetical protein MELLADRAFT_117220 [Melampsora larici-populina 98AG31]